MMGKAQSICVHAAEELSPEKIASEPMFVMSVHGPHSIPVAAGDRRDVRLLVESNTLRTKKIMRRTEDRGRRQVCWILLGSARALPRHGFAKACVVLGRPISFVRTVSRVQDCFAHFNRSLCISFASTLAASVGLFFLSFSFLVCNFLVCFLFLNLFYLLSFLYSLFSSSSCDLFLKISP
jgi:hypothetical protein